MTASPAKGCFTVNYVKVIPFDLKYMMSMIANVFKA